MREKQNKTCKKKVGKLIATKTSHKPYKTSEGKLEKPDKFGKPVKPDQFGEKTWKQFAKNCKISKTLAGRHENLTITGKTLENGKISGTDYLLIT